MTENATAPLLLAGQRQGSGLPLVILHGLLGAADNWSARARVYADQFDVIGLDLRNHGDSPHTEAMSYPAMADDVWATLGNMGVEDCLLMGHSMGGKVAMQMALQRPEALSALVCVDIAPRAYSPSHEHIIAALQSLDISHYASRREADRDLQARLADSALRAFLLKNMQRVETGGYRWRMNLAAIARNYPHLLAAISATDNRFNGPCLFIKGANSDYLQPQDTALVNDLFPMASAQVISGAGHWPHAERPAMFDRVLIEFLQAVLQPK